jgi:hypothetical protein
LSVIYRTIFEIDDSATVADVETIFTDWLRTKNLRTPPNFDVPPEEGEVVHGAYRLSRRESALDSLPATRIRFTQEDTVGEWWATELTTWSTTEARWLWIDLIRVAEDPYARPAPHSVPRLTEMLLHKFQSRSGGDVLVPMPLVVRESASARALAQRVLDAKRSVPFIVMTLGHGETEASLKDRANEVQRRVCGIASVILLFGPAQPEFERTIGEDLSVFGGGLRTYLPGVTQRHARRNRYIPGARLAELDQYGWDRAFRGLVQQATSARPPAEVRSDLVHAFRGATTDRGSEELLADLIAVETATEEKDAKIADLTAQLRQILDDTDALRHDLDKAQRTVAWHESNSGTPAPIVTEEDADPPPSTCTEAIERSIDELDFVVVGDAAIDHVGLLDNEGRRSVWAETLWNALSALNAYGEAKSDGFDGDIAMWLELNAKHPVDYVGNEGPTVRRTEKYRAPRTFSVPTEVDESGRKEMFTHVRIGSGKPPAPRLHFYDDTRGSSTKVHVGYVGPHLPTPKTN